MWETLIALALKALPALFSFTVGVIWAVIGMWFRLKKVEEDVGSLHTQHKEHQAQVTTHMEKLGEAVVELKEIASHVRGVAVGIDKRLELVENALFLKK